MERLQKVLARAGIASRRKSEEYILAGRVTVDGKVVRELGTKVDPAVQDIRCDGQRLRPEPKLYFVVNKPRGMVCSNVSEGGRPRVIDLFPGVEQRLFTVGRLDVESEGLLIVTNDGEFANRLMHPRYGVRREYMVEIDGVLSDEGRAKLLKGVHLAEGPVRFETVESKAFGRERSEVRVVIRQGVNREIRRAFARVGCRVRRLRRVAIGRLSAPELRPGAFRKLRPAELAMLREDAGGKGATP